MGSLTPWASALSVGFRQFKVKRFREAGFSMVSKASRVRNCPACHEVLMMKFRDATSGLEIDSCPECFGLWFDGEELKLIFESPTLSKQILEEDAAERLLSPEDDVPREDTGRTCPACVEQRLFSSKLGSTQVDYCLRCHGIWFDRSELEELVQAYYRGERGNLIIINQLAEGLGTPNNPNPKAQAFMEALKRYQASLSR